MKVLTELSPYWQLLMDMIVSINEQIPLEEKNQVLIVLKLNTEEKVKKWFEWLRSRLNGENELQATEAEIVRATVQIDKGLL